MRIAKRNNRYCIELTESEMDKLTTVMFEWTGNFSAAWPGEAFVSEKRFCNAFNTFLAKAREKWERQKVK